MKANAYGHGIKSISACLYRNGVRHFAVFSPEEAEQIRNIVPDGDILIFGVSPADKNLAERIVSNRFIQTVVSLEQAKALQEQLEKLNLAEELRCHVKIDTGMSRFGVGSPEELEQILELTQSGKLKCEALFTHFSSADSSEPDDVEFTVNQQYKFAQLIKKYNLKSHSQNSAGTLYHRDFGGDFVRTGLALYGFHPDSSADMPTLRPVMSLKSVVTQIREVGAGVDVGYNRAFVTDSPKTLAVIPVGYADGYSRLHSSDCKGGKFRINGKFAPVCGKVCMDYTIVDVTEIKGVKVGSEAVIYSDCPGYSNPSSEINIAQIARSIGTIPYEVTCSVAARVPRIETLTV